MLPSTCLVDDTRSPAYFRSIGFGGHKKVDVKKALLLALQQSEMETACYWVADLVCAGHADDVWDVVIPFYARHIHVGNPHLASFLAYHQAKYTELVNTNLTGLTISLRNNVHMRTLFAQVIALLCYANQQPVLTPVKLETTAFDPELVMYKWQAPSATFALVTNGQEDGDGDGDGDGDQKPLLFPVLNEFAYHVSQRQVHMALYWMEWILTFVSTYQQEEEGEYIVWITHLWNVLSATRIPCVCALRKLFVFPGYVTRTQCVKRKGVLSAAVALACEPTDKQAMIPVLKPEYKPLVQQVVQNIHAMYAQLQPT